MMPEQEIFPREVISNVPRITLTGNERLHLEQHRGLIAYQPDGASFRTSAGLLRVSGAGLRFRLYTSGEAVITGRIDSVSIETGGGRK